MGAVGDKDVRLAERPLVEQQVQPLACCEPAALVLGLNSVLTAAQTGLFTQSAELLKL